MAVDGGDLTLFMGVSACVCVCACICESVMADVSVFGCVSSALFPHNVP